MRRAARFALVSAIGLVACSSGDGASLSLDDLDGESCPVALDEVTSVEREDGDDATDDRAPLADHDGIYVACDGTLDGSTVTASLYALRSDDLPPAQAIFVAFPRLAHDLELTVDDLQEVADALVDDPPPVGEAVDVGADGPGAITRVEVDGATSAALYVVVHDDSGTDAVSLVESLADTLGD